MPIKNMIEKIMAVACMTGVMFITNMPLVYAYEMHVMNVVANIVDDSVSISPAGNNFCNDGSFKVELKSAFAGASIYYTLDGIDPVCGKNGNLYSAPFPLTSSKTVKAVSCHGNVQSLPMSKSYTVSYDYCDHTSVKINKVYYYTDRKHSATSCPLDNEWVELYNPTNAAVNIKGWKICDGQGCDVLGNFSIAAKGYALISVKDTTWQFWNIPSGTVKIALGNAIGKDGFSNTNDMVALKDAAGNWIDEANWGTPDRSWANYNSGLWDPGAKEASEGQIFGRVSNGVDTDKVSNWTNYSLPDVAVISPNGGEKWSVGKTFNIKWNASGNKSSLTIDLYYSNDAGSTWGVIAKGVSNSGTYSWSIPAKIASAINGSDYSTVSGKGRVKVVATDYSKNFMLSNWDTSDANLCLSAAATKSALLGEVAATGNSGSADGGSQSDSADTVKSSEIKNEDGEDYVLSDSSSEKSAEKGGDDSASSLLKKGSASAISSTDSTGETISGTSTILKDNSANKTAVADNTVTTGNSALSVGASTGTTESKEAAVAESKSAQTGNIVVQTVQADKNTDSADALIAADKDTTTLEFNLNA